MQEYVRERDEISLRHSEQARRECWIERNGNSSALAFPCWDILGAGIEDEKVRDLGRPPGP